LEFIRFLHCQLLLEAELILGKNLAEKFWVFGRDGLWQRYSQWLAKIDTAARFEKWVPFHTCLQEHERFILEEIHTQRGHPWTPKRRFIAMFQFRVHCRVDLFRTVQLPLLGSSDYWESPKEAWRPGGTMERSILAYRRRTHAPLQTGAFRIIPRRLVTDDDTNLVRNISLRNIELTKCAEEVWPIVESTRRKLRRNDVTPAELKKRSSKLYVDLADHMRKVPRVGATWVKMLMVCIDHLFPRLCLLQENCEVGVGAKPGLSRIMQMREPRATEAREGLKVLTQSINRSSHPIGKAFRKLLREVEKIAREKYKHNRLLCRHLCFGKRGLSAGLVQVQLCEWRQFLDFQARQAQASHESAGRTPRPLWPALTVQSAPKSLNQLSTNKRARPAWPALAPGAGASKRTCLSLAYTSPRSRGEKWSSPCRAGALAY